MDIYELERRVAAYDADTATRAEWQEHVTLVRELFRRRIQLLGVIRKASEN